MKSLLSDCACAMQGAGSLESELEMASQDESSSGKSEAMPVGEDSGLEAPPAELTVALAKQFQSRFIRRRRSGREQLLAGFVFWALFYMLVLGMLSELSLRLYTEHWCKGMGLGSIMRAVGASVGVDCAGYRDGSSGISMGLAQGQHWMEETYGFMLRVCYTLI